MKSYFTQWRQDQIAAVVTKWTNRVGASVNTTEYGAVAFQRKYIKMSVPAAGRGFASWDVMDADADRADTDMVTFITPSLITSEIVELVSRADATLANAWFGRADLATNRLKIVKHVASVPNVVADVALTWASATHWAVRFRINKYHLKIKAWDATKAEPAAWNAVFTDALVIAVGYVGLACYKLAAAHVGMFNCLAVRTNPSSLLTYGEALDNAAWGKNNCTVAADTTTAPDGSSTADTVTVTTTSDPYCGSNNPGNTTGPTFFSVHVKAGGANPSPRVMFRNIVFATATTDDAAVFEFATKSWISGTSGLTSFGYVELPDSWFRLWAVKAQQSGQTGCQLRVIPFDTNYVATQTVHAWGARIDVTSALRPYAPEARLPMSDALFAEWCAKSNQRRFLAKMTATGYSTDTGTVTTVNAFVANGGFNSWEQDEVPNQHYEACIKRLPTLTQELGADFTGEAPTSFGYFDIRNNRATRQIKNSVGVAFNGVDRRITLGNVTVPTNMTIAFWIKPTQSDVIAAGVVFSNANVGSTNGIDVRVTVDGKLTVKDWVTLNIGDSGVGCVSAGRKSRIHITNDGSIAKFYVDGVLFSTTTLTRAATSANTGYFGWSNDFLYGFGGILDEFEIWSVVKTDAQIAASINDSNAVGTESNLDYLYHFDEAFSTTTVDSTASPSNGTLNNTSMWSKDGAPAKKNKDKRYGGEKDHWLNVQWKRDPFEVKFGPVDAPEHDCRTYCSGRLGVPSGPNPTTIRFPIADLGDIFNNPVTTAANTAPYENQFRCQLIGPTQGHIEPPRISTTEFIYDIAEGGVSITQNSRTRYARAYNNLVELAGISGVTVTAFTAATDIMTTNIAHGMLPGWRFEFQGSAAPGSPLQTNPGSSWGIQYWVSTANWGTSQFSAAPTFADAMAGTNTIDITTAGSPPCSLVSWGFTFDAVAGKLYLPSDPGQTARITIAYGAGGSTDFMEGRTVDEICSRLAIPTNMYKSGLRFELYRGAIWLDTTAPRTRDVFNKLYAGAFGWWGVTPDGLMLSDALGHSSALLDTVVPTFVITESNMRMGSLSLVKTIRQIDFSRVKISYAPWYCKQPFLSATNNPAALQLKSIAPAYSYGATGRPMENFPPLLDSDVSTNFDLNINKTDFSGSSIPAAPKDFYLKKLGIYTVQLDYTAMSPYVHVGGRISMDTRMGWELLDQSNPASPDNPATMDSRYGRIIGKTADPSNKNFPVTLTLLRQMPAHFPIGNLN